MKYREMTPEEEERVDRAVTDWHLGKSTWINLGQYLGMNWFETGRWVTLNHVPTDWSVQRIRTN